MIVKAAVAATLFLSLGVAHGSTRDQLLCAEKLKTLSQAPDQSLSQQIEKLPGVYQERVQYSRSNHLPLPFRSSYVMALDHCDQMNDASLKEKIAKAKAAIEVR
jgi:hypothetical protein